MMELRLKPGDEKKSERETVILRYIHFSPHLGQN